MLAVANNALSGVAGSYGELGVVHVDCDRTLTADHTSGSPETTSPAAGAAIFRLGRLRHAVALWIMPPGWLINARSCSPAAAPADTCTPGVAVADALRSTLPDARAVFLCTRRDIDRVILEQTGYAFGAPTDRATADQHRRAAAVLAVVAGNQGSGPPEAGE